MEALALLKHLLTYDALTGQLTWTENARYTVAGKPAGTRDVLGYTYVRINGKCYKAHRVAWALAHDKLPSLAIDHINGDRSDNRLCNLREVSHRVNLQNQRHAQANNKASGLLGVSRHGSKWKARLKVENKRLYLGVFDTPEEAHQAYVQAKRTHHEGNTL